MSLNWSLNRVIVLWTRAVACKGDAGRSRVKQLSLRLASKLVNIVHAAVALAVRRVGCTVIRVLVVAVTLLQRGELADIIIRVNRLSLSVVLIARYRRGPLYRGRTPPLGRFPELV